MNATLRALVLPLALLAAAPATGVAQVKIPAGTYEMVPDSNYAAGFDVAGVTVEFTETTMAALQGGALLVKSNIKLDGDIMTLSDVEGQVACPSESKYKVTVTAMGVRLTPVEDPCSERSAVLAQVTLVKKG